MKYLIVGLGNPGADYKDTRHNIGYTILDALATASNVFFEDKRYGFVTRMRLKNRTLILLKPTTFMNLSGLAVRYWMKKEKIEAENLLVIVDDVSLALGRLRLKPHGSDGGHNGLKNIQDVMGSIYYPRLRFGIGDKFPKGAQVEYVLGKWDDEELKLLPERVDQAVELIKSFCLSGLQLTMTAFNNK